MWLYNYPTNSSNKVTSDNNSLIKPKSKIKEAISWPFETFDTLKDCLFIIINGLVVLIIFF